MKKLTKDEIARAKVLKNVFNENTDFNSYRIDDYGYIYSSCECGYCKDCKKHIKWTLPVENI